MTTLYKAFGFSRALFLTPLRNSMPNLSAFSIMELLSLAIIYRIARQIICHIRISQNVFRLLSSWLSVRIKMTQAQTSASFRKCIVHGLAYAKFKLAEISRIISFFKIIDRVKANSLCFPSSLCNRINFAVLKNHTN